MNSLSSSLLETYSEYSIAPTDDLISFWRSKVKVIAVYRGSKSMYVDASQSPSSGCFCVQYCSDICVWIVQTSKCWCMAKIEAVIWYKVKLHLFTRTERTVCKSEDLICFTPQLVVSRVCVCGVRLKAWNKIACIWCPTKPTWKLPWPNWRSHWVTRQWSAMIFSLSWMWKKSVE